MFIPLDDLSQHTEEQRDVYYKSACAFLQVPPELNVLKWFWDDSKQGKRSLILYATRGATDIIRGNKGISTIGLETFAGAGFVTFTAIGQDPSGRIERAVGVAHTGNKHGAAFENAVKKAQTEANRRMTLQFAGGGFLDESELPIFESTIPASTKFAEVGGPIPATINNEAGRLNAPVVDAVKEIIKFAPSNDPKTQAQVATVIAIRELQKAATEAAPLTEPVGVVTIPSSETPEEFSARMDKLRDDAKEHLAGKAEVEKTEAPKRKRRSKNSVSIETPGTEAPKVEVKAAEPTPEPPKTVEPPKPEVMEQKVVVPPPPAAPVEGAPTTEQLKSYRERLSKYANETLPSGGMLPTAGIGGITMKLRAFAKQFSTVETSRFSSEQWEELLNFLDDYSAKNGVPALVSYINKALGIVA